MANCSVVALCRITTSAPDAQLDFTGKYDSQGNATLAKQMVSIMPGTVFAMDDADPDFARFISAEAIRQATPIEVRDGFASDL